MIWMGALFLAALSPLLSRLLADAWAKQHTKRTSSFFNDEKSGSTLSDTKRVP